MIGNNKIKFKVFNIKSKEGFTIMELLVSIAVFSIMITTVSSIFISVIGSQRKNIGQEDVLDNARYVLESISRSIRQGSVVSPVNGGGSSLELSHPTKGQVVYDLLNNQIVESINSGGYLALSSNNIYVSRLNFQVSGNSDTDNTQPRVTISISLRNLNNKENEQSSINLQTTITPRDLQYQK